MTKLATLATLLLSAAGAAAFSPAPRSCAARRPMPTALHLFGSKPKGNAAPNAAPGMMDQIAMFKKAQEFAQKKAALDKELAAEDIRGSAADGKVSIQISYVPPKLPARPTPGYEATAVDIDATYLEGVSAEDLSAALVEAVRDGERTAAERVGEKYRSLEQDMKAMMGQGGGATGTAAAAETEGK